MRETERDRESKRQSERERVKETEREGNKTRGREKRVREREYMNAIEKVILEQSQLFVLQNYHV